MDCSEHDEAGYALPGKQVMLAKEIAALGKPTVVVVLSGMAVGMDFLAEQVANASNPWSIVVPGYGARFGATALAEMIFGEFSPSGRLGYTVSQHLLLLLVVALCSVDRTSRCTQVYPEAWAGATPMADMSLQAGQGRTYKWFTGEPTFAFGSGISYTNFSSAVQRRGSGHAVTVTNTGMVAAAEVVLVFAKVLELVQEPSELKADLPVKQLCAFDRTPVLAPGASVSASTPSLPAIYCRCFPHSPDH